MMIRYMRAKAKQYIAGTLPLADVASERKRMLDNLNLDSKRLDEKYFSRVVAYSHNKTQWGYLPRLEHALKKSQFNTIVDAEVSADVVVQVKQDLLEALLFIKYELKEPGIWAGQISEKLSSLVSKLGVEQLNKLLNTLSKDVGCEEFRMIESYVNLQALELVNTRYLHNGFNAGRKDGYVDRADDSIFVIKNPVTLEDEEYRIKNIKATITGSDKQEQSLLGKIYVPVNKSAHPMMHISWRGSKNKASWGSDMQIAAGFDSYFAHEAEIIQQISETIDVVAKEQGQPISLMVSGHSLGGALSQNNFQSMQRALSRGHGDVALTKQYNESLCEELKSTHETSSESFQQNLKANSSTAINPQNVNSMHVAVFNSPGVLGSVAESSNACSRFLTSQEKPIAQYAHFSLTHGDSVQQCGKGTILSELETNGAEAEMFYFDNGQAGKLHKMAALSTAVYTGAVAGSLVPIIGSVVGAVAGGALMTGTIAYGLLQGHTKNFLDENGEVTKTALKELKYYSSRNGVADIAAIKKELHTKDVVLQNGAKVSARADLLGKREELKKRVVEMPKVDAAADLECKEEEALDVDNNSSAKPSVSAHLTYSIFAQQRKSTDSDLEAQHSPKLAN